jgi:hypothetical protein
MGNQPSAPSPPPQTNPPPPIPPVCDANCQRQKKLSGLKAALDAKTATRDSDPEGYEQARIAYFTELNGQGWLATEKQNIAKNEIEPVLSSYQARYQSLVQDTKNQGVFVNLMNMLKSDEQNDEEDLNFLKKKERSEKDKANTLNRLTELNSLEPTQSYFPTIIDVALAILGIFILYMAYKKFTTPSVPTVMAAGKRVLDKLIR